MVYHTHILGHIHNHHLRHNRWSTYCRDEGSNWAKERLVVKKIIGPLSSIAKYGMCSHIVVRNSQSLVAATVVVAAAVVAFAVVASAVSLSDDVSVAHFE